MQPTSCSTSSLLATEMLTVVQPGFSVRFMVVLRLGRDCPRLRHHGARSGQSKRTGRGINGGDPRLRGEPAVYAAKARRVSIDREHGVIRWQSRVSRPSSLLLFDFSPAPLADARFIWVCATSIEDPLDVDPMLLC